MTTPISKRRRIDSAASTLSKPFRSPFKRPQQTTFSIDNTSGLTSHDNHLTGGGTITRREPGTGQAQNQGAAHRARLTAISQKPPCETTWEPTSAANLNADIDIISLKKLQRAIERQLRELREELDVAEQARKIEIKSKKPEADGRNDGELLDLIIRWKTASRDAADEVFGGVKDRVNRMGGPRAWREMQRQQEEFRRGFDEETSQVVVGDAPEGGRDEYKEWVDGTETPNEREARTGNANVLDEGPEDEFTMQMMLRSLNIDLHVVGYDAEQQRWLD